MKNKALSRIASLYPHSLLIDVRKVSLIFVSARFAASCLTCVARKVAEFAIATNTHDVGFEHILNIYV